MPHTLTPGACLIKLFQSLPSSKDMANNAKVDVNDARWFDKLIK